MPIVGLNKQQDAHSGTFKTLSELETDILVSFQSIFSAFSLDVLGVGTPASSMISSTDI